jgi:hypothetical protein
MRPIQRQPLLVQYKQQASQSTFINAQLYFTGDKREWQKSAVNIIKLT